jgi:hypothetical protein
MPEMITKLNELKNLQEIKERRYPLLHFNAEDDIQQVRAAVLYYYMPLLNVLDYQHIS